MEDYITSFFVNGLKFHIESSINKYLESQNIIFEKDFDNLLLNPVFINNIHLFREIINQNNLNYQIFWSHIGKIMKTSIESLIQKFEEEINKQKENENEENKIKLEIGNKNIIKLKILNICCYFITNEDSDSFESIKGEDKEIFKNLLELYIKKEIDDNNDFSLFIKNYLIKISLLINDNCRGINFGFLRYISLIIYNFESLLINKEQMNNLKIYIDQAINNPRREINNYLNSTFYKKSNKKEKLNRSRGTSFDIKDVNANTNNYNIDKKNKKIEDFFKPTKKEKKDIKDKNNNIEKNSNGNKSSENNQNKILNNNIEKKKNKNENENEVKNIKNKGLQSNQGKLLNFSSHASNLSLINFNSGLSNHSNSFILNNSFSFSKNNNNITSSKISLDDSLSLTGIFSTPISELNDNKENNNKKYYSKYHFPSIIKCVQNTKRKPLMKINDKFYGEQMKMKNYMKIGNKKNENEDLIELRNIRNSSFYGNNNNNNYDKVKRKTKNEKNKNDNCKKNKNNKNNKILINKTPNEKENRNDNKEKNFGINNIKKNWKFLFTQKTNN